MAIVIEATHTDYEKIKHLSKRIDGIIDRVEPMPYISILLEVQAMLSDALITEINVASSGYELWGGIDDWCIHFGGNPFKDIKPLKYTIAELCGEEEE